MKIENHLNKNKKGKEKNLSSPYHFKVLEANSFSQKIKEKGIRNVSK